MGTMQTGVRVLVWLAASAAFIGTARADQHASTAAANQQQERSPRQIVTETVDAVFKVLRDPGLKSDAKERMRQLRLIVDKVFDWAGMAQSSLGHHWRKLDDTQRADFVAVFKELLAQEYMDDIDRFQGTEQVMVKGAEQNGELWVVHTVLITASREQVPIDYTLHRAQLTWTIDDVSIENVSLVAHYRTTFSRFLTNHTFAELLERLRKKLGLS
jgi:phospholipid transport system substrate-binding protein